MTSAAGEGRRTRRSRGGDRWQPLRLGLVDLFYYDTGVRFRDGRLLLRGNNGTGKSKVLALTLPFLLDGDLSPHRVEPDGDAKRGWSGTCCSAASHDERLGYAWLEFGRRTRTAARLLHHRLRAEGGGGARDRRPLVLSPPRSVSARTCT